MHGPWLRSLLSATVQYNNKVTITVVIVTVTVKSITQD